MRTGVQQFLMKPPVFRCQGKPYLDLILPILSTGHLHNLSLFVFGRPRTSYCACPFPKTLADYFGQSDWMAQRPKFPIARTTSPLRLNMEKQGAQSNVFKDITPLQLENMSEQLKCGRIKAGISERRNRRKNGRQRYSQEYGAALRGEFAATPIKQKPTELAAIDSIMTQSIISRF